MLLMFFLAFASVGLLAFGMECAERGYGYTALGFYLWSVVCVLWALAESSQYPW